MKSQTEFGGLLSFLSAVLIDLAYVIIKWLDINAIDALLPRCALQALLSIFIIYVFNYQLARRHSGTYTSIPNSDRNNEESGDKISIWINGVDEGMNIHIIRSILILQGICGPVSAMCAYISVTLMPFGDAMAIIFSSQLPTMTLAFFCLGQRLRFYKIKFISSRPI